MHENANEFDNESSLRTARKNLPFAKLLDKVAAEKKLVPDQCPCCLEKTGGLVRRAVATKKIERATIDAIEQIDIVKVVSASLQLKRQGANWVCCCPFHNEKHPSFNVNPTKNIFKCFGCKEGGGPIQFVRKIAGLDFIAAVEKLAGENGITIRYETNGERTVWRCTNGGCVSATAKAGAELDEVGFVAKAYADDSGAIPKELSRKEAFKTYLKLAGVISESRPNERFKPKPKVEPPVLPNPVIPPEVPPPAATSEADEELWKCIEIIRKEGKASAALLQRRLKVGDRANGLLDELERRGMIGPAKGTKPRVVLKLPPPRPNLIKIKIGDEEVVVDANKNEDVEEFAPGDAAAPELPDGTLLGRNALEYFYSKLSLLTADDDEIFRKRSLTTTTNVALGFVSSLDANYDVLHSMSDGNNPEGKRFEMPELIGSGLWLPDDKKKNKTRRPNAQFCGWSQLAKKPKSERSNEKDKWIYGNPGQGWCDDCKKVYRARQCPGCGGSLKFGSHILIPYFDEAGKILKLRPHKGGAPGATLCGANRIYVPRDFRKAADTAESFFKVVITEGEFKAAALWQTLGAGRTDGERPIGVCALPGIYFGKHYDIREELEAWMQSVGCEYFEVAFDDEDKSDKKEMRERHEALIWAQYLAASVAKKLQITGRVCVLPKSWRIKNGQPDVRGKADWDGALAQIVHGSAK